MVVLDVAGRQEAGRKQQLPIPELQQDCPGSQIPLPWLVGSHRMGQEPGWGQGGQRMQSPDFGHATSIQPAATPWRGALARVGSVPTGQEGHGQPARKGELRHVGSCLKCWLLLGQRGARVSLLGHLRGAVWDRAHGLAIKVPTGSCSGTRTEHLEGR